LVKILREVKLEIWPLGAREISVEEIWVYSQRRLINFFTPGFSHSVGGVSFKTELGCYLPKNPLKRGLGRKGLTGLRDVG